MFSRRSHRAEDAGDLGTREQARELSYVRRGIVPLGDAGRTDSSHPLEPLGGGRNRLGHRLGERVDGGGRHQPAVHTGLDQLGDACHVGADRRAAQGQRLHQHHGESLGEARQHQGTRPEDLLADCPGISPARQGNVVS